MIKDFLLISKKGEGTFSEVLKCQNIKTKEYFALKKMKQRYDSYEQVNNLREIQAMRRLNPHENILTLHEIIFDPKTGTLSLILELMDKNLYELIKGRKNYLPESEVKNLMWQLMQGLCHIHNNGIFHRDVKPENILIRDRVLKIADFGSCKNISSRYPYTEYISTRWYRAPECLLTDGYYSYEMDIWSVGCVLFEIMSLRPLFPGANEVDQISKIHDILGTPDPIILKTFKKSRSMSFNFPIKKGTGIERMLTHVSPEAITLIKQLCQYDPCRRVTAHLAMQHSYFKEFRSSSGHVENRFEGQLVQKKHKKSSLAHVSLGIKENKENTFSTSNNDSAFAMTEKTVSNSSRSTFSKSPLSVVSTSLVKSDQQSKLQEITSNFNKKANLNMEGQLLPSNIISLKKKSKRVVLENNNSKPWPSQSYLPRLYNSKALPEVNSQSSIINSFFSKDQMNYVKSNSLSKFSKYYSNNKNSHLAQVHRRYQLRPSFK